MVLGSERMSTLAMVRTTAALPDALDAIHPHVEPPPFQRVDDAIVAVHSEWNGWRTAMVRVAHLENIHWAQPQGAPRPLLHAVVSCDRLHSGGIAHHCEQTPPPHRLSVCVLKSHTQASVFAELSRRADSAGRTVGIPVWPLTAETRIEPGAVTRHGLLAKIRSAGARMLRVRGPKIAKGA